MADPSSRLRARLNRIDLLLDQLQRQLGGPPPRRLSPPPPPPTQAPPPNSKAEVPRVEAPRFPRRVELKPLTFSIDLLSFIDREKEFILDLTKPRVDEPLGIREELIDTGRALFVTEFTVTKLVGEPLLVRVNSTGAPQVEFTEGEGRKRIIEELFITNTAQPPGSEARIVVGWNSRLAELIPTLQSFL